MLVFFIFGIFAYIYIYIYIFIILRHDDVGKYFLFTRFGSYVDVSILACFHMYIHVGMEVGIHTHTHTHIHTHIYICVCACTSVCVCACTCVYELRTCIIMFTHTCPCENNLILGYIDRHAHVGCYEN